MAKIGRNQPCPCGSGNKYKHCCLSREQSTRITNPREPAKDLLPGAVLPLDEYFDETELDRLSNRVVDLLNDGHLDEAEQACRALKEQSPEVIDWLHRTAMVHEARGNTHGAIEYYQRTLAWMDENPGDFEPASRDPFRGDIERLTRALNDSSEAPSTMGNT